MASLLNRRSSFPQFQLSLPPQPSKVGSKVPVCRGQGQPETFDLAATYAIGETLGSGSVAVVRRATRRGDNRKFALKCIESNDEEVRRFARSEFELVQQLNHTSIVKAEAFHESPSTAWICMELCPNGSVESFMLDHGVFFDVQARPLFAQLLHGVNYLHQKRVVHRDLKPDNLVLLNNARSLKISDFNSAIRIGNSASSIMLTDRGTRDFCAPELRFGRLWNERVDIWSCGLCMYFMLRGSLPFNIQRRKIAAVLIVGTLPPVNWDGVLGITKNLVQQCLTVDMCDRPPAMELLKHRAFSATPASELQIVCKPCKPSGSSILEYFFAWLPACGLVAVHSVPNVFAPSETLIQTGSKISTCATPIFDATVSRIVSRSRSSILDDWRERRDGALQLSRLAESKYKRTQTHVVRDDDEKCAMTQQPSLLHYGRRYYYSRSSGLDASSMEDASCDESGAS